MIDVSQALGDHLVQRGPQANALLKKRLESMGGTSCPALAIVKSPKNLPKASPDATVADETKALQVAELKVLPPSWKRKLMVEIDVPTFIDDKEALSVEVVELKASLSMVKKRAFECAGYYTWKRRAELMGELLEGKHTRWTPQDDIDNFNRAFPGEYAPLCRERR